MRVIIEAWREEGQGRMFSDPDDFTYAQLFSEYERLRTQGYTKFTAHRVDIVCDFCSYPQVCYRFEIDPGGLIGITFDGSRKVTHVDRDGKWAACMECSTLIALRDWKGLLDRSVEMLVHLHPEISASFARAHNQNPHRCFQRGYHGQKPIPVISDADLMGTIEIERQDDDA